MSGLSTHNAQAEHNEKLADKLSNTNFIDWSITCAFYAALHYAEAVFTSIPEVLHGEECYNKFRSKMSSLDIDQGLHVFRENLIGKKFPKIKNEYHHLRMASYNARYLKTGDKPAYEFFPKSTLKLLLKGLKAIRTELQG